MNRAKMFIFIAIVVVVMFNMGCSLNQMMDEKIVLPRLNTIKKDMAVIEHIIRDEIEEHNSKSMKDEIGSDTSSNKAEKVIDTSNIEIREYLLPLENSEARVESLTHVVLHFTSNALHKPQNPYIIEDVYDIFKDYGVSAHYVIGRQGEIYSFVPEDRIAYHAGSGKLDDFPKYENRLNHHSIGIELLAIGTKEEMMPIITQENYELIDPFLVGYTEEQYGALNLLLQNILERYPNIKKDRKHIVGHDEYSLGRKTDPGDLFDWSKIGF